MTMIEYLRQHWLPALYEWRGDRHLAALIRADRAVLAALFAHAPPGDRVRRHRFVDALSSAQAHEKRIV